jgi:hypothetical protein
MDLFSPSQPSPLPPEKREGKGNPLYPPSQGELLKTNSRSSMATFGFKGNDPFPPGVARRGTSAGKFFIFMRSNNVDGAMRYGQLPPRLVV